jgi:excisionase family DNA binding protein
MRRHTQHNDGPSLPSQAAPGRRLRPQRSAVLRPPRGSLVARRLNPQGVVFALTGLAFAGRAGGRSSARSTMVSQGGEAEPAAWRECAAGSPEAPHTARLAAPAAGHGSPTRLCVVAALRRAADPRRLADGHAATRSDPTSRAPSARLRRPSRNSLAVLARSRSYIDDDVICPEIRPMKESSFSADGLGSVSAAAPDDLLTAEEVAAVLRVTPAWVYAETRRHRIPHLRLGRYVRYRREALEEWMRQVESRSTVVSGSSRRRDHGARR